MIRDGESSIRRVLISQNDMTSGLVVHGVADLLQGLTEALS